MTVDEQASRACQPRNALRLLATRDFGGFFWGRLATVSGVYLHTVVASVVIYGATGSTLAVALLTFAQFAPQLVLGLVAGAWADRGGVVRQIVLGRLLCMAGSSVLALWLFVVGDIGGWWQVSVVVAASLVTGLGLVLGGPAMQSVPPLLVRRDELATAMALNTVPMTVGRVVGPAVGAVLTDLVGPVQSFGAAAVAHLLFVGMMMFIRVPGTQRSPQGADTGGSIAEGIQYVRRDRPMLLLLAVVAGLGFGSEPTTTLAPVLAHELGGDVGTVGALTASFGAGAGLGVVISSVIARRVRHELGVGVGVGMLAAGVAGCAGALTVDWAMVAIAVGGGGFIIANSSAGTLIQLRVPEALRGRVMALWLMGFVGSRPISALLSGAVADVLSARAALLLVAACLVGLWFRCRPRLLEQ